MLAISACKSFSACSVSVMLVSRLSSWLLMKASRCWSSRWLLVGLCCTSCSARVLATTWARSGLVSSTAISRSWLLFWTVTLYSGSQVMPRASMVAWRTGCRLAMSA